MSIENNKEKIKERRIKGVALSDDELEKVSGGELLEELTYGYPCGTCPNCGGELRGILENTTNLVWDIHCITSQDYYNDEGIPLYTILGF